MEFIVRFKGLPGFSARVKANTRWEAVSKVAKDQGWDKMAQMVALFKDASVRDAKKEELAKTMEALKVVLEEKEKA